MFIFLQRLIWVLLLCCLPMAAGAAGPDLRELAVKADHLVVLRHARAPGTGDPPNFRLGDCSTQRNLSQRGQGAGGADRGASSGSGTGEHDGVQQPVVPLPGNGAQSRGRSRRRIARAEFLFRNLRSGASADRGAAGMDCLGRPEPARRARDTPGEHYGPDGHRPRRGGDPDPASGTGEAARYGKISV